MISAEKQLEIIKRGTVDVFTEEDLTAKLKKKKPLRIKLGVDPSSPDIHLGHTVVLNKLRQFQDLGHQAVLIIGDYTALVGDPSGEDKTRPQLNYEQVKKNSLTYLKQVEKILDIKRLEIVHNGEWFKKLSFHKLLHLASKMTVARILERDDFSNRFKKGQPICLHEFLYPLMQAYDSVMVKSDIEIGGTDQTFNLLAGRDFQKASGEESQICLTLPLLVGLDGAEKMSKSLGNYIGVNEKPKDMYGKLMSISDELMVNYYELLSQISIEEFKKLELGMKEGKINPRDVKAKLAFEIVERFYDKKTAEEAREEFKKIFKEKKTPSQIEEITLSFKEDKIWIVRLIKEAGLSASNSQARRLLEQGAVSLNGERVNDPNLEIPTSGEILLKVGKYRFRKVRFN